VKSRTVALLVGAGFIVIAAFSAALIHDLRHEPRDQEVEEARKEHEKVRRDIKADGGLGPGDF